MKALANINPIPSEAAMIPNRKSAMIGNSLHRFASGFGLPRARNHVGHTSVCFVLFSDVHDVLHIYCARNTLYREGAGEFRCLYFQAATLSRVHSFVDSFLLSFCLYDKRPVFAVVAATAASLVVGVAGVAVAVRVAMAVVMVPAVVILCFSYPRSQGHGYGR